MNESEHDDVNQIERLRVRLTEQPGDVGARTALGNLYLKHGELDQGVGYYESILEFDRSADAYLLVGSALLTADRCDDAVYHLETARMLDPQSPHIAGELGLAYLRQGHSERARALLQQGLQPDPTNEEFKLGLAKCAFVAQDYWQAIELCKEVLENDPIDEQSPLLVMGDCFAAVGGLEEAHHCYVAAVELEPYSASARAGCAYLCLALGQDSEAEQVVRDGLALQEDSPELHATLGHIWMHRAMLDTSAGCFERAIELDRSHVSAYGPLATVYLIMNKPDAAARVAADGLRRDPENVECLVAGAQAAELQGEHENAVVLALRGIARERDNYHAHLIAGRSQLQAGGDIQEAKRHLKRAQELAPEDAPHEAIARLLSQIDETPDLGPELEP